MGVADKVFETGPIGEPFAIGRESRPAAIRRDKLRFAAQRRHQVDAAAVTIRAERDSRAVRRKGGFVVIGWILSHPNRSATSELLNPDVEVFTASIGSVRHARAIR